MNKIEEKVFDCICSHKKYLVAVSGGADSMVLLHVANQIADQKDASIRAITIEHGIRGKESQKDAQFVETYCKEHNINCKVVHVDVPKMAKENKETIEESARNLRYKEFYKELAPGEILLVAHNLNDQAETILMHIFRGSGIDGARGIGQKDNLKRPLLQISKQEILCYAKENNIPFVSDTTNDDISYNRNYIRKEILPKIEQLYPKAIENLSKFADFCAQSEYFICSSIKPEWINISKNNVTIDQEVLSQNPLVFAKVIKLAYNSLGEYSDLESKHIDIIKDFWLTSKDGLTIDIPHGIIVEKRKNNAILYKNSAICKINCNFGLGENVLPNGQIVLVEKISKEQIDYSSGNFFADYHKIPFDAIWRTRQDGDRFQKLGSRGSKKLNDYFTDKKFDFASRNNQILLAKNNVVLFVAGIDIAENVKVDAGTEEVVRFILK